MAGMCFDLSDALESYQLDNVETDSCVCCRPVVTSCERGVCKLHSGIDLEVSQHPHSMRQVVNLIIALNRLKTRSTDFSDDELCNILFENLVEEYVTPEFHPQTHQADDHYEQSEQVQKCYICDQLNKFLVLRNGITTELQAITLQAGNMSTRVQLELSTYKPSVALERGRPVALGVGGNLYLSCTSTSGKPVLSLEVVKREELKSISGDMRRFLFFKTVSGQSLTSFESAKHEGYFISTSPGSGQRVEICQSQAVPNRLTMFKVL